MANNIILKDLYKDYFKMGVACERINGRFTNHEIGNPDKEALMLKHFNSMTFGNELKPMYNMAFASEEAKEDYLPFAINESAKAMLDFARANKMPVRGHVLVWHSQCPKEIFCKGYEPVTFPTDPEILKERPMMKMFEKLNPVCFVSRDILLKRLKSYIFSLMEYMYKEGYMDTIYAWDVVNEAIELEDKTPTGLRNSYWYQIIGEDFIYWAFKYAVEAVDEMAAKYKDIYGKEVKPVLFYNDYNEFQPEKKKAILEMLNRESNGHGSIVGEKLISGIGMQGHLSDNNDIEEYKQALYDYGKLGVEVHITELDVKCTCKGVNEEYYQAVFYKEFFKALTEAKKNGVNITCVTFWGLTDDNSWIRGANPLLFHKDLSEKKSFDGVCFGLTGGDLGEPEIVKIDLSDRFYDFEGSETAEELGFTMKGFGDFTIQDAVSHSGSKAINNAHRFGEWTGVAFDVTDFIGQTILVSAWVRSKALEVILKADEGNEFPVIASAKTGDDEWAFLSGEYKVPRTAHSMQLLFGTREEKPDIFNGIYVDDVSVKLKGLYESFEDDDNIAAIRGVGHLPVLSVTDEQSHDGKSKSLRIVRQEKDATVKFDVSPYIGNRISFEAYVKTKDTEIKLGLDGDPSIKYASVESNGEWTLISADIELSDMAKTAEVYIETNGSSEYYVDDIVVRRL